LPATPHRRQQGRKAVSADSAQQVGRQARPPQIELRGDVLRDAMFVADFPQKLKGRSAAQRAKMLGAAAKSEAIRVMAPHVVDVRD